MKGKPLILYFTYITNFSRAGPDTDNQELTLIINSIRDTVNHNQSSYNVVNWVTCSPSLCRSIEIVQVPWPAIGVQKKERCNFCRGIVILWVRSCGSHCKSEGAFCHGSQASIGLGPSFGYTGVSAPEVGSRMGCSQWPQ